MHAALLSLAFMLLHTSAMVVAFDSLDKRRRPQWLAVPAAHLGAALLVRHHGVESDACLNLTRHAEVTKAQADACSCMPPGVLLQAHAWWLQQACGM